MFKKFIGILLVLVLALSLVACGEKGDKPAEDSAPASSDAAPAAKPGDAATERSSSVIFRRT